MYASPISIHAPREGATTTAFITRRPFKHFNPRPPRGGRPIYPRRMDHHHYFNPRPPRGGRPYPAHSYARTWPFQSTPPARGATPVRVKCPAADAISIHAPREGGDGGQKPADVPYPDFNPRPPRGGRRYEDWNDKANSKDFNPRPPRGGRQGVYGKNRTSSENFNPRPPRGGRLYNRLEDLAAAVTISIHAPREGGDLSLCFGFVFS